MKMKHRLERLRSTYWPYLPALMTLTGGVMLSIGLLGSDPALQWFQFAGAMIAAIGAFWSGHRAIVGAKETQEHDEKIVNLQEQLRGHVTGGDSFCFAYPVFDRPGAFTWVFIHHGRFPITDASVHIYNLEQRDDCFDPGKYCELGVLLPGRAHTLSTTPVHKRLSSHGYNLFFTARNGSWTQEIRWVELASELAVANRVIRDGTPRHQPLLLQVSPRFPSHLPEDDAWNARPPYGITGSPMEAP